MSQVRALRVKDVAAYLRVTHQRGTQQYAEGKLPKPDQIRRHRTALEPARIERWAEREW